MRSNAEVRLLNAIIDDLQGLGTPGAMRAARQLEENKIQWDSGCIDIDELAHAMIITLSELTPGGM